MSPAVAAGMALTFFRFTLLSLFIKVPRYNRWGGPDKSRAYLTSNQIGSSYSDPECNGITHKVANPRSLQNAKHIASCPA